jgi:hypothetical protein
MASLEQVERVIEAAQRAVTLWPVRLLFLGVALEPFGDER